jgi:DNA-binding winged helix-turn-helix (wHTH) protein/TolB-like protein/tetratricopeptide (TPR) repeat protein
MLELSPSTIYEFGEFRLNAKSRRLFRGPSGELVPLSPKAAELLLVLVQNKDRVLTKDELLEAVWGDTIVEESNLSQTIFVLRKALQENTKEPRFILTIPNRGYRFIGTVGQSAVEDTVLDAEFLIDTPVIDPAPAAPTNTAPKYRVYLLFGLPLLVLLGVGVWWFYPRPKPASVGEIRTIAILPFEDLSAGQTEKYLGVSLTDALINKFSGLKPITVRPTRAVLKYANTHASADQIGRELQVDAVLDGRIQRVGDRLRVSVQLIRTSDNATIWTENFDDEFVNFFAVQDSISLKVVNSLALQLNDSERERLARRGTTNADAYQDYLRGRFFWNKRTADDLQKAIGYFNQAIQKDPAFALAYTGLADSYQLQPEYGATAPRESFPQAKAAINRALELDDRSAEAHAALGYMQTVYDWDWPAAEASFKRALELDPNCATAHQWYAEYLTVVGRFDESYAEFARALQLEPLSPIILSDLASNYDHQGRWDEELAEAKKVIELEPNFAYGYFFLALAYEGKGMNAEAATALARSMTLFGEPPEMEAEVMDAFRKNGIKAFWQKRLEQVVTRPHLKNFQAYGKALLYVRLGDKERTYESLEEAFQRRDRWIIDAKYETRLASLHPDARFQDLLRRMNL